MRSRVERRAPGPGVVALAGPFELEDVGPEVGEELAADTARRGRGRRRGRRGRRGGWMRITSRSAAGARASSARSRSTSASAWAAPLFGLDPGRRFGLRPGGVGPAGFGPGRQPQPGFGVHQPQHLAVRFEDQPELPAPQPAVRRSHRPVFAGDQPIPLESRLQVVPERVEQEVLGDLQHVPVQVELLARVLPPGRGRGQFDDDVRAAALFPQQVVRPHPLRHPEDHEHVRGDVPPLVPLLVEEEQVARHVDVVGGREPVFEGLDEGRHQDAVLVGLGHRATVRGGIAVLLGDRRG